MQEPRGAATGPLKRLAASVILLPAGAVLAVPMGAAFAAAGCIHAARRGAIWGLRAVLNLPFDVLIAAAGWGAHIGFYALFAGTAQHPQVGWLGGSLIFTGGPIGVLVGTFAAAFTPTSTVFVDGRRWSRMAPDERDRLVNHELWHARRQFARYTGWLFWPAYLGANVVHGLHHRNPFESGPNGPYTTVDARWESGFKEGDDYVRAAWPLWG